MVNQSRVVLVACGGGIASSHVVKNRIIDRLEAYGLENVTIKAIPYLKARILSQEAALYVNLSPNDGINYACPVMSGIPFLTGFGIEAAMEELKSHLDHSSSED